jgi:hypothetical protein
VVTMGSVEPWKDFNQKGMNFEDVTLHTRYERTEQGWK